MTDFHYTGRDEVGRFVSGTVVAQSRADAIAVLRLRTVALTSVRSAQDAVGRIEGFFGALTSDAAARLAVFRSLAALVGAGLPLQKSLQIVGSECANGRMREAIRGLSAEIEHGSLLEAAMSRRPREFAPQVRAMVRAGEIAGSLDDALRRAAGYMERSHALRKRVSSALVYPIVVSTMALGLIVFLLGTVVPAFSSMFSGLGVALPPMTRAILAIGTCVDTPLFWLAMAAAAGAAVAALRSVARVDAGALRLDGLRLRLPVVGELIRRGEVAACARTLGALVNAGVVIETAIEAARDGSRSAVIRSALDDVLQAVRLGETVAGALAKGRTFGSMLPALARAGEESGTLGEMLVRVAEHEEIEIESTVSTLGSVLEPLLLATLGGIVGTIVAAVLVPLYSMIGSIQ